jgi:3-phosphoshikimate 1-carboxyvinyltransferase
VNALRLTPGAWRPGVLTPPQSKSDAQRALVLAHVRDWNALRANVDVGPSAADDVRAMARGLDALRGPGEPRDVECGEGGAPFRLLLAQAALTPGRTRLRGSVRLGERPRQPLLGALRDALGAAGLVIHEGSPWPVEVVGVADARAVSPRFRIDARESSQFASSLLLAATTLALREGRPWTVETAGSIASAGYLDLTTAWVRRAGFDVETAGTSLTVSARELPVELPSIPGDWSSIAYLLLVAWKSGGAVERVDLTAPHPDRAVVRLFESVGLSLQVSGHRAHVTGTLRGGLRASAAECPDLIPTLAALACVLPVVSRFDDVAILRQKESDRLEGVRTLVASAGGRTREEGGGLTVEPPKGSPRTLVVSSRGDHRQALSAATLACLSGASLALDDPQSVTKSFPEFWAELAKAGVRIES